MMSHQPLGADYPAEWPADFPYTLVHQGISAEMMAEKWELSREALDDYAYQSHLRAMHAIQTGYFEEPDPARRAPGWAAGQRGRGRAHAARPGEDGRLKPVFKADGVITAGNASQVSDGAAALLLASPRRSGATTWPHGPDCARHRGRLGSGADAGWPDPGHAPGASSAPG